jgi:hypothetical protein
MGYFQICKIYDWIKLDKIKCLDYLWIISDPKVNILFFQLFFLLTIKFIFKIFIFQFKLFNAYVYTRSEHLHMLPISSKMKGKINDLFLEDLLKFNLYKLQINTIKIYVFKNYYFNFFLYLENFWYSIKS